MSIEDLREIAYLPLDLPRFTGQDEIRANFNANFTSDIWTQNLLLPSYAKDLMPYDHVRSWLPEAKERMPKLIEYIEANLPFKGIVNAKILRTLENKLGIHVDIGKYDWSGMQFYKHQYDMAPAGYRVILDGEAEKILYYTDAVDTPREHWVWAKFPPGVNTFCHSSVDSLHGAEYYPGLNRAILFIHGWLDEKRHWEIIKRSASKYTDYVITFDQLRDHRCMS